MNDDEINDKRVALESQIENFVSQWNDNHENVSMSIDSIEYSPTDKNGFKEENGGEFADVCLVVDRDMDAIVDEMTFNVNDTDFTISERLKDFSDMVEEQIDVDNIPDDDDGEDDDTGFRM